ncbi:hypothetical protein JF50_21470 [Pseudoalteromonas luteoviolacea]|uniref:Uncharacterized protein n=1 Tax=Pseudoalteromonas luteoviolacea TaxID=43657 RepID=A0A0C1QK01_9GAMM|nr:DUF6653 family protein [Pseudoalteromonas luteoviolacea]KID55417.1 hypothetical protein JF50_21470 [Pseudoalteromonas luteoviolacea]
MRFESLAAKYFSMSEDVWQRHANPWSVWTRYTCLPLLIACIWWRDIFGVWFWPVLVALIVWICINPRCFKKPAQTDSWASKSVLGERILIYQRERVAVHHFKTLDVISALLCVFTAMCVAGLFFHEAISTCCGAIGVILAKTWFLDRMVWIYQEASRQQDANQ